MFKLTQKVLLGFYLTFGLVLHWQLADWYLQSLGSGQNSQPTAWCGKSSKIKHSLTPWSVAFSFCSFLQQDQDCTILPEIANHPYLLSRQGRSSQKSFRIVTRLYRAD